jgi:hypothetical protein
VKLLALSLALLAPGQEAPSPSDFRPLNRVQVIINEECITAADVQAQVARMGQAISSEQELAQAFQLVATNEIVHRLKAQAGKDMGFEPDMVSRFVRDQIEGQKERAKSAAKLGEFLAQTGTDSAQHYETTEDYILAELWTRSVVGRFPGPGGRPYVDRYVRPGLLVYESERREGELELEEKVVLQQLVADPRRTGSLASAKELAEELREEILAGEDFARVAEDGECAAPGTGGIQEPHPRDNLMRIPELADFLADAQVGDVSEVLPYRDADGVLRAWRVIKLLDVLRESAGSFTDPDYQKMLTENRQQELDTYREDVALNGLLKAAFVWPPEAFGRPQEESQREPIQGPPPPPPQP